MAYAKFDDGFADHPKHRPLSHGAFRLHVSGILHCSRWLTDGLITAEVLPDIMRGFRTQYARELVERGLWLERMSGELYEIRDYLQWNDSRDRVESRRRVQRERIEKWREINTGSTRNQHGTDTRSTQKGSGK
jgi:hypothetical protein